MVAVRNQGTEAHGTARVGAPEVKSGVEAAMLVGTAALIVLGVQPLLLGALTHEGRLSAAQLGQVATLEALMLAAGAAIGPRLMMKPGMRLRTAIVGLLLTAVNLLIYVANAAWAIYVLRSLAGLLEGLAMAAVVAILTHTRNPDRTNGIFLALSTMPQAAAAYYLPTFMAGYGANSGFLFLAICALVGAAAAFGLPNTVVAPTATTLEKPGWTPAVILSMAAIVVQYAGIAGAFNYVEVLARQHHLDSATIGIAVSGTLVFQVIGAFLVAWIGWRVPLKWALLGGALLQCVLVVGFTSARDAGEFIAVACLFGTVWLGIQPFQVRQLIHVEHTRSAALLLVPMVLLGMSAGPFVVSFFVRPDDVSGGFWGGAVLMAISIILYLAVIAADPKRLNDAR